VQLNKIYNGNALDVLKTFPDESVDMVITSPPYWALRDYGAEGQLGLESTFQEYINKLCDIFDEVKRVLKKSGSCWVNLGDAYSGSGKGVGGIKSKSLLQIPSRFAIEMCNRGWILRNEIIWHKPNAMPSSVNDRFTVDYEKLFFFVKSKKYYFEQQKEQMKTNQVCGNSTRHHSRKVSLNITKQGSKGVLGQENSGLRKQDQIGRADYTGFNKRYLPPKDLMRNKRSVWSINTKPFKEKHFATYPEELIITPIKACCPENGIVLDPFMGSGTTAVVARGLGLKYVGIELNPDYIKIADKRLAQITIYDCL
jgi:DNA modification methylase